LEKKKTQSESAGGQRQHGVVIHQRRAAEVDEVPGVALRDPEEHASRAADPVEMIEADARELGEGDRQKREVDARDAEAEGEKADNHDEKHEKKDRPHQAGHRTED